MKRAEELLQKLSLNHSLSLKEYEELLRLPLKDTLTLAKEYASLEREKAYGKRVFIRGLIECSNICKNDCYYCGIRKSNTLCERYLLNDEEIFALIENAHKIGFRSFVLQSGDGAVTLKRAVNIIKKTKSKHKDSAITLSFGEMKGEEYEALFKAGADRYLLRHETALKEHYSKLHPEKQSYENRIDCIKKLREVGFQVGIGFMVGSPYQGEWELANDLKFVETFAPEMCGIGPFMPATGTPFAKEKPGSYELTLLLISLVRIIRPNILLPSTTALASLNKDGLREGLSSGANVIMPPLVPTEVRLKYNIYDNKIGITIASKEDLEAFKERIQKMGFEPETSRGEPKEGVF